MAERRQLIEGLKAPPPPVDANLEREFVFGGKAKGEGAVLPVMETPQRQQVMARSPISTRIRADFAAALKRASLERQLAGETPNTLQEILEEALEPWLKSNGYLS
jgi:hypothetical protein